MNRRRDGGSDRFLAALTMRFALKMSAKMVASVRAIQGYSSREPLMGGLPTVLAFDVSL